MAVRWLGPIREARLLALCRHDRQDGDSRLRRPCEADRQPRRPDQSHAPSEGGDPVIHSEALAGNRAGLEPDPCEGHLAFLESYPDSSLMADRWQSTCIAVYECDACRKRVAV